MWIQKNVLAIIFANVFELDCKIFNHIEFRYMIYDYVVLTIIYIM